MHAMRPLMMGLTVSAMLATSLPALAGQRDGERHAPQAARGAEGHAQPRSQARPPAAAPSAPAPASRPERAARPEVAPPAAAAAHAVPRTAVPRAVPPAASVERGVIRRAGPPAWQAYREPRVYGYSRPRVVIPVMRYRQPYYTFSPRYAIGFGLYVGVPVAYPVYYGVPSYVYGYAGDGYTMTVDPNSPPPPSAYGGLSFDVTPSDATLSIDGAFIGQADDFSPTNQPLTLTPGRHHVELQAEGLEPLAFDVDVAPGQVIPYRGSLRPY